MMLHGLTWTEKIMSRNFRCVNVLNDHNTGVTSNSAVFYFIACGCEAEQ